MSDTFLTICPRDNKYINSNIQPVSLKVVMNIDVTPDVNFKINDLNKGYKQIINNSNDSDKFKIQIVINRNDEINFDLDSETNNKVKVITALDYWIKNAIPLFVVSEGIDIKDGEYIIFSNPSRKQEFHNNTIWDLEFIRYTPITVGKFKKINTVASNAVKKFKNKKASAKKATTAKAKQKINEVTALRNKLKKCNYKNLKYSKNKKVVACVKTMQTFLWKKGCYPKTKINQIDGWYGSMTKKAVKKYQSNNAKKYGLKATGNVDKNTYKLMCGTLKVKK